MLKKELALEANLTESVSTEELLREVRELLAIFAPAAEPPNHVANPNSEIRSPQFYV